MSTLIDIGYGCIELKTKKKNSNFAAHSLLHTETELENSGRPIALWSVTRDLSPEAVEQLARMKNRRNRNATAEKIAALAKLVIEFLANNNEFLTDELLRPLISGAATKPSVRAILRHGGNLKKVMAKLQRQKKG